jgi:hypothetical protein
MNAAVVTSFDAQLARLAAVHNETGAGLSPETGFVSFVFHAVGEAWPSALRAPNVQGISLERSDRSPWLATVGYVCHCVLSDSPEIVAASNVSTALLGRLEGAGGPVEVAQPHFDLRGAEA